MRLSPSPSTRGAWWLSLLVASSAACSDDPSNTDPSTTGTTGTTIGPGTADDADGTGESCPAALLSCAGACVDPQHDPLHCGECDQSCADGLACVDGVCAVACGPQQLVCDGACADPQTDAEHCGGCNQPCGPDAQCVAGSCVADCEPLQLDCAGTCRAITNDEQHCGACDAPCPADQPCVRGQCVATSLHHVLIAGQSLSIGSQSTVVSTEQPFDNLSFASGVRAGGAAGLETWIPLIETQTGSTGETLASGMANLLTERAQAAGGDHRSLVSAHGVGGAPYSALRKGTGPYAIGMAQVAAASLLAGTRGEDVAVRAVVVIHGETDHVGANASYDLDLLEWQSDYEADIQLATGQTLPVPLITDQMSSYTAYGNTTSIIPQLQLEASRAQPDRIIVMGPKYMLPYVPDGVHLTGEGERWLGEMHAKVFENVLIEGEPWHPVSPRSISREGAQITVRMWVPAPPLVLDDVIVTDPGNYGFEYTDSSDAPPVITNVELVGDDSVRITLSETPVGGNQRIRYAFTGIAGQPAGPSTGARGNLRDSDATTSRHGYALYNWCVHFDEAVE